MDHQPALTVEHQWDDLLLAEELAHVTRVPLREARTSPLPEDLHPELRAALARQGIEQLYEHLDDRDAYLAEVRRVLRPDGVYLVSTPQVARTTDAPENPFHRVEYSRADFERLLRRYFGSVSLYGQRRLQTWRHRAMQRLDILGLRRRLGFLRGASVVLGTAPTAELTSDDLVISADGLEAASELVAVCRP